MSRSTSGSASPETTRAPPRTAAIESPPRACRDPARSSPPTFALPGPFKPVCEPRYSPRVKVLLVGSGGREHALAWKLSQAPSLDDLHAAPGNPGIAALG